LAISVCVKANRFYRSQAALATHRSKRVRPETRLDYAMSSNKTARKRPANPYLSGRVGLGAGTQHSWETHDGTAT